MFWKILNLGLRNSLQGNLSAVGLASKDLVSKTSGMFIHTTSVACKEPMKKKKKLDPALVKSREDRKKKRIEREIKRLSKIAQQYKPIDENEISLELKNSLESRKRSEPQLSGEQIFERHKLLKEWSAYKKHQFSQDISMVKKVLKSKDFALKELKAESEELYREAIQLDMYLLPFKCKGPTVSPPIRNYDPIDGDIVDVTRKWEIE